MSFRFAIPFVRPNKLSELPVSIGLQVGYGTNGRIECGTMEHKALRTVARGRGNHWVCNTAIAAGVCVWLGYAIAFELREDF